jgi:hypothetical protein
MRIGYCQKAENELIKECCTKRNRQPQAQTHRSARSPSSYKTHDIMNLKLRDMAMFFHSGILECANSDPSVISEEMDWVVCDDYKEFALRDRTWGQRVMAGHELMEFLMGKRKNIGVIHADFIRDQCTLRREAFKSGFLQPVFTQNATAIRRLCVNMHQELGKEHPRTRRDVWQCIDAIEARVTELADMDDRTLRTPSDDTFAKVYGAISILSPHFHVMGLPLQEACSIRLSKDHYQTLARFNDGMNYPIFSYNYRARKPLTHKAIQNSFEKGAWDWKEEFELGMQYADAVELPTK